MGVAGVCEEEACMASESDSAESEPDSPELQPDSPELVIQAQKDTCYDGKDGEWKRMNIVEADAHLVASAHRLKGYMMIDSVPGHVMFLKHDATRIGHLAGYHCRMLPAEHCRSGSVAHSADVVLPAQLHGVANMVIGLGKTSDGPTLVIAPAAWHLTPGLALHNAVVPPARLGPWLPGQMVECGSGSLNVGITGYASLATEMVPKE